MLQNINRPINFRPILLFALSLAFGITLRLYFPTLKAFSFILPLLLALVCYLVLFFATGKATLKDKRKTLLITVTACLTFIFLGFTIFAVQNVKVTNGFVQSGDYVVEGEVDFVTYKDGVWHVGLKDCLYDGKKGGKLFVFNLTSEVKLYDKLRVKCKVSVAERYENGKVGSNVVNGYSMLANYVYGFDRIGVSNRIYAKFKTATDNIFITAIGKNYGVFSALIRGDTSQMGETVEIFRLAGIAHIFAVSGMHVGLLFAGIMFLFKKLRVNRLIRSLLSCFIVILYSYLCGLTPSSLRAAIMCCVMAIGDKYLGEKYDAINSLSFSMIVVLLINPGDLMSAGFLLSFGISFSIIVLSPPIKRVLSFLPQNLSSSLSVLIASQVFALPLSVKFFGSFSMIGFFANLVLLPVVSILFYLTVIGVVVCLILPINEYIALFIPNVIASATTTFTEVISRFPLRITYFPSVLSVGYYSMLMVSSDFINANKKVKFSCVVIVCVVLVFVTIRSFFPFTT